MSSHHRSSCPSEVKVKRMSGKVLASKQHEISREENMMRQKQVLDDYQQRKKQKSKGWRQSFCDFLNAFN